jgi:hypothetical protein
MTQLFFHAMPRYSCPRQFSCSTALLYSSYTNWKELFSYQKCLPFHSFSICVCIEPSLCYHYYPIILFSNSFFFFWWGEGIFSCEIHETGRHFVHFFNSIKRILRRNVEANFFCLWRFCLLNWSNIISAYGRPLLEINCVCVRIFFF